VAAEHYRFTSTKRRLQRPRGRRRGSAAVRWLELRVRIPWGHECLSLVSVVCCQVEVCDGPITRPEKSYRVWCVWVWCWNPLGPDKPWKKKEYV